MGDVSNYQNAQNPAGGYGNSQNPAPQYAGKGGTVQGQVSSQPITNVFFHMYLGTHDIGSQKTTDEFIKWYIKGANIKDSPLDRWDMLQINLNVITDGSDIKKARKDLTNSLFTKDSLVIYIGHTIPLLDLRTKKLLEAPLNPCRVKVTKDNKYLAQTIRNKELTTIINHKNYAATTFLIASCSSVKSVGKILHKKKTVITVDSGDNFTTPVYFFARALEVFLNHITGYQVVDPARKYAAMTEAVQIPATTVKDAIDKANASIVKDNFTDKFVFSSGKGDFKLV
jgi:hypothetical protein